jgi:hypothetical protein
LLIILLIGVPIAAWAQWSTNSNDIYKNNSGNVGIGTTTPAQLLEVVGNNQPTIQVTSSGTSNSTDYALLRLNTGANTWQIATGGSNSTDWSGAFYLFNQSGSNTPFIATSGNNFGIGGSITGNSLSGAKMVVLSGGNVGIGTTSPSAKLDVDGNVAVSGNIVASGNLAAKYQDIAELVPSRENVPDGFVVVLDDTQSNAVIASSAAYDTRVAGVVSPKPGLLLGEKAAGRLQVATMGRVKVRVDATAAPVRIGDLLVTSGKRGMAMKSQAVSLGGVELHRPGTILGKALEALPEGEGEILVLLSLQ